MHTIFSLRRHGSSVRAIAGAASETRDRSSKAGQSGEVWDVDAPNQETGKQQMNSQDCKLPRLEAEDGEKGEADDKESEGGQVEATKEEKAIPATYCWPASARFYTT